MPTVELLQGDCIKLMPARQNNIVVSDPPFNIGYHYDSYNDKMPEKEYMKTLKAIFQPPCVMVHYPEDICKFCAYTGLVPTKVVSWVYNSNTGKQHRDIAFFGVKPDFRKVTQPYKNPNDKRVKALMASGKMGGRLYDWWNINQVKNVSKDKTAHPCQMPIEVMKNIIGILPDELTVIDAFMGSGTTGVACAELNRNFIGIEIDEGYYNIAKNRIMAAVQKGDKNGNDNGRS